MAVRNPEIRKLLQANREVYFKKLYERNFPIVAKLVRSMGGDLNDAQDIFQDTLVVFYEKVMSDQVEVKSSANAYLLGISKHLWYQKTRRQYPLVPLTDMEKAIEVPEDYVQEDRKLAKKKGLIRLMEKAGQKCLQLLHAFYFQGWTLDELRTNFGYSTIRSATVQKHKCLEKVRKVVEAKREKYEDILG